VRKQSKVTQQAVIPHSVCDFEVPQLTPMNSLPTGTPMNRLPTVANLVLTLIFLFLPILIAVVLSIKPKRKLVELSGEDMLAELSQFYQK